MKILEPLMLFSDWIERDVVAVVAVVLPVIKANLYCVCYLMYEISYKTH